MKKRYVSFNICVLAAVLFVFTCFFCGTTDYSCKVRSVFAESEDSSGVTETSPDLNLAAEKSRAIRELENYRDKSAYRKAEQEEYEKIVVKGKLAINAAKDAEELNQALTNAKDEIGKLKTDAEYEKEISFDKSRVLKSLEYMLLGMLLIFAVIGFIAVGIFVMNKLTSRRKKGTGADGTENGGLKG